VVAGWGEVRTSARWVLQAATTNDAAKPPAVIQLELDTLMPIPPIGSNYR
jgi:hypothetical protein